MRDLLPGILFVLISSLLAIGIGKRLSKSAPYGVKLGVVIGCTVLIIVFRLWVEERLWVTKVLPVSGALTWVAWTPIFACIAVSFGWDLLGPRRWRRVMAGTLLVGISVIASFRTFFDRPAESQFNYRSAGWTLQTTQASCSPSSAVNLLKHYGIETSESEMADKCLTTYRGTTRLGLYRGLKLMLAGTNYHPSPFWGDVETLLARTSPAIIFVELRTADGIDPRYLTKWGWTVGLKHVVVFAGRDPARRDEVRIIDPAIGMENWHIDSLRLLFQGEAVEIVENQ